MITDLIKKLENRGKPLFNQPEKKPLWWPASVPWALKKDPRPAAERTSSSWTAELKVVLASCYKHFGCLDLLSGKCLFPF